MNPPAGVDRYAVLGNPIAHSLSPQIHARFAAATGQALEYVALELPRDGFESALRALVRDGLAGANVTVPFKQQAWALCDSLSERAEIAGAVNTLAFDTGGAIAGDNTDGIGMVRDLRDNLDVEIARRRVLVLGAGGAVRGVLGPVLAESPAEVVIANRTLARARALAEDFAETGQIRVLAYKELGGEAFDLVINGTAAGLAGEVPPVSPAVIGNATVCYDMMYNTQQATAFVDWARRHEAGAAHDGLGMLVEQAAEAFRVWRGVRPETGPVIAALRGA